MKKFFEKKFFNTLKTALIYCQIQGHNPELRKQSYLSFDQQRARILLFYDVSCALQ